MDAARVELIVQARSGLSFSTKDGFSCLDHGRRAGGARLAAWRWSASQPSAQANEREQRTQLQRMQRWIPENVAAARQSRVSRPGQSYYFEDVSADFSEERLGEFRAIGAELWAGPVNQSLGSLKGITAWKDGTMYFASVDLWEGVKLDSLEVQLARPAGAALGVQATLFGGSLRFDVSLNSEQGMMAVDSAVSASNIEVAPLAALLGYHGNLEGVIRDVKFTFRGVPERALGWPGFAATCGRRLPTKQARVGISRTRRAHDPSSPRGERSRPQAKGEHPRRQRRVLARSRLAGMAKAPFLLHLTRPLTILARWQACSVALR